MANVQEVYSQADLVEKEQMKWHNVSYGERYLLDDNGKIRGEITCRQGSSYIVALANEIVIGRYVNFGDAEKAVEKAVKESPVIRAK